jgi:hypothetical protein
LVLTQIEPFLDQSILETEKSPIFLRQTTPFCILSVSFCNNAMLQRFAINRAMLGREVANAVVLNWPGFAQLQ